MIDNNIYNNNREIYRLQKQIDTLKEHYGRTIEYAYKNRSNYDMLNFIFTSTSFNDAVKRVSYLKSYRTYRDDQVANIIKTKVTLEKIATLLEQKREKPGTGGTKQADENSGGRKEGKEWLCE